MKRSNPSEESSDSKRFEAFSPQHYQQQQQQYQTLQMDAVQQYGPNQQQQQQQQHHLQAQQMDAAHQQQIQQYAATQKYAPNQQVQSPHGTQSYPANQQIQTAQQQQQQKQQQQHKQQQQQHHLQAQQMDAAHQQQIQQYTATQKYAPNQQVQSPQGTQSYPANQQIQTAQQQQKLKQQQQHKQQQQQQHHLQAQQMDAAHQQQIQQYAATQKYAPNQQVQSPQGTQSYPANQQIQTAQQQQQFTANQQYYNPAAFYTMNSMNSMGNMNSINFSQFVPPPPSPMMYNNSPSWNFMSQPPPSFYATTPPPSTSCQPPLPPPDLKPEKPPLPKEPEPGTEGSSSSVDSGGGNASAGIYNGMPGLGLPRAQNPLGAIRLRGLNGMNTGFNSFNGGLRGLVGGRSPHLQSNNNNAMMHKMNANLTGMRGRRRNPHFFPQMQPAKLIGPPMELQRFGDFGDFARLIEDDQPAGPEKLTIFLGKSDVGKIQVNKKAKRKPMSTRYTRSKQWVREEAEAAIALEKEFNRMQRRPMLILKFPDPDLNKYIVKKYSPLIDTVHFQQPSTPRYCFVQLKEGADVDKVINTIRQIPFGTGKISAELKNQHVDDQPVTPEGIDPYTLYIGNLPTHISVRVVKQYFPNAQRIDIGYAQRMRYTRYAFIRYNTVAEAMASYKRTVNALLDSRSLIVRFRRQKGNIGLPGEVKNNAPLRDGTETLKIQDPKRLDSDESMKIVAAQDCEPVEEDADDEEYGETAARSNLMSNGKNVSVKSNASIRSVSSAISSADTETRLSTCTPLESKSKISKDISKQSTQSDDLSDSQSKEGRAGNSTPALESFESDADSKDRVLEEANDLMKRKIDQSYRRSSISSSTYGSFAKPPGHVEGDIKLEETDDDSSDDGGINLLGTRVKDEPYEEPNRPPTPSLEDIYLDDYEYDDLDCEPEEEDDEWATNSEATDWDEVRRNELAVRESKPDLDQLSSTNDFIPTEEVPPIPADLEPKPEFENFFDPPTKKKNKSTFNEKDDLHDMFAQLNSDPECDEEDAFFN